MGAAACGADPARRRREARRGSCCEPRGRPGEGPRPRRDPAARPSSGRVHFVGIGGAGLSGIARIMARPRRRRSAAATPRTRPTLAALRELGVRVYVGHAAEQRRRDADTLVVSTAVREDNPEVVEALRRGLRVLPRSAGLAAVMAGPARARRRRHPRQDHDDLAADRRALQAAGADPSYAVGGDLTADRRQRRTPAPATSSSPRPTRATAPSSSTARTPRSSPTSRPTTSTTGAPRRPTARPSTSSLTTARPRRASWSCCVDDPGAAGWPTWPAASGRDRRRGRRGRGRRRPRRRPPARRRRLGLPGGATAASSWASCGCRSRAGTTSSTRWPRWRRGCGSASASTTWSRGLGAFTGTRRRMERKGEAGGRPGLRQLRPPPDRDRRRPRRRPARSPARAAWSWPSSRTWSRAPGIFGAGDGRGARRRRRGRRARRLPRPRGRRPRGHRRAGRRRVPLPAERVAFVRRLRRRRRPSWSRGPGPATWC